jgi:hypothetical protein
MMTPGRSRRSGRSGTRCLVWITVAAAVSLVVSTSVAVRSIKRRMLTALTLSSAPWSITLTRSPGPIRERVIWRPPVPQPRAIGSSREPNGTW